MSDEPESGRGSEQLQQMSLLDHFSAESKPDPSLLRKLMRGGLPRGLSRSRNSAIASRIFSSI